MVIHTQRKVCKIEIKDLKEQFNIPEDYSPISLKKELKGLDKTSVLFKNGKDGIRVIVELKNTF